MQTAGNDGSAIPVSDRSTGLTTVSNMSESASGLSNGLLKATLFVSSLSIVAIALLNSIELLTIGYLTLLQLTTVLWNPIATSSLMVPFFIVQLVS